jgi:hypothetical protein
LPKTIRRSDGKGAGAIVGFANFLLRLYADEQPRAVVVSWDTLETPTKRHQLFPAYQSGRAFAQDLIEQLSALPEFVAACGFANAKAPGFEADDFLVAAVATEERAGGSALVASGDRDSFQLASQRTTILYPSRLARLRASGRKRSDSDMASIRNKARCGWGHHGTARPCPCLNLPADVQHLFPGNHILGEERRTGERKRLRRSRSLARRPRSLLWW